MKWWARNWTMVVLLAAIVASFVITEHNTVQRTNDERAFLVTQRDNLVKGCERTKVVKFQLVTFLETAAKARDTEAQTAQTGVAKKAYQATASEYRSQAKEVKSTIVDCQKAYPKVTYNG